MSQAKTLNAQELRRVMDYIATRKHAARNRAMVCVSFFAGLRAKEIAALRVKDVVDPDGKVRDEFYLTAEQSKGNYGRTVTVSEKLKKELSKYIESHKPKSPDHMFFYTQKRMREGFDAASMVNYFYHLYRNVGIYGASSHSGRRSMITAMASKNVSVRVIMAISGHRQLSSVQRYIDVNSDQLRAAVELI
jgi:integrase/recombinase XerD